MFSRDNPGPIQSFLRTDDAARVRRVLEGRREEYAALVRRHWFAVYARAYARLGGRAEAAAVAREAFVEAYRRLDSLGKDEPFEARVWAAARELCKHPPAGAPSSSAEPEPDRLRRIRQTFLALDESSRLAVLLRYGAGRSAAVVAETLGLGLPETQERLRKAEESLGAERLRDVVAAVSPPLSAQDVADAALRERVSWHAPEPAPPRRRLWIPAVAVAAIAVVALGLLRPGLHRPSPAHVTPPTPPVMKAAPPVVSPVPPPPAPAPAPEPEPVAGTGTVAGRVVDAETGAPVIEFEVSHPEDNDEGGRPVFLKTSDPEGRFFLSGLPAGEAEVRVRAQGRAEALCRVQIDEDAEGPAEAVVRLRRARTVEGAIADAAGKPVADARVFVDEAPFPFLDGREAGRTDASGRFTAAGVPEGAASLFVYHPDYALAAAPAPEGSEPLRMTLEPAGRIEGTLRADGVPLANASVRATPAEGQGLPVTGYTDGEGRFRLDAVAAGPAALFANWGGTRWAERETVVEAGQTARLDADFARVTTRLEGRVTQHGKPVQFAEVEIYVVVAEGEGYRTVARTDTMGVYRSEPVPPGAATLRVMAVTADSRMRRKAVETTVPASGTLEQDIDFAGRASLWAAIQGLEPGQHARVYVLWSALERRPATREQLAELTRKAVAQRFVRANGNVGIDPLEPGRYTVFAIALREETPEEFAEAATAATQITVGEKGIVKTRLDLE